MIFIYAVVRILLFFFNNETHSTRLISILFPTNKLIVCILKVNGNCLLNYSLAATKILLTAFSYNFFFAFYIPGR